ncbi:MAG: hypothetical protein KTR18_11645 [Acidiferrobacterales bacterium]|nr:hypothetical protein [Acidiferrobacterales bacterium]
MEYLQLEPNAELPKRTKLQPFKAVLILDEKVEPEWQEAVSDWLVASGCLYMMAWGQNCSSWDDSVDLSNLKSCNFGDIPEDEFVTTTWHENEPLKEVFWFAKNVAEHPTVEIENTLLVHISWSNRKKSLVDGYQRT